ncbi:MAG: PGF-pre-PGF domain-containing protein [Candidatus Aenigmarchaeota archaeon]|nr:PGF-pre-PGF domain-containing protein [Candidatus Aenigmarchaeota archaeon]
MNKKGLIGAIKYGFLLGAIVSVIFLFAMPAFAVVHQSEGGVIFSTAPGGNESIGSTSQFFPTTADKNYGFAITVSNASTTSNVLGCTFITNLTGTFTNYTNFLNTSLGANISSLSINFTKANVSGAGVYYYEWICNNTGSTEWNQTANVTYVIAQNATTASTYSNMSLQWNGTVTGLNRNLTSAMFIGDSLYNLTNVTGNYSSTVFSDQSMYATLTRNSTVISTGSASNYSDVIRLGAGYWNYTYFIGNTNYSNATIHYNVTISQNTTTWNITISNASIVNKTHTVTWFLAKAITDKEGSGGPATSWCGYSMNNTANVSMTNASGEWYVNITVLPDGYHNITYWCNTTGTNYTVTMNQSEVYNMSVAATPTVLSSGSASGYTMGTIATMSLTTDTSARCRYSQTAGTSYDSMESSTTTELGTSHSWSVVASAYTTYNYYFRCNDSYGTLNTNDYPINFTKSSSGSGSVGTGGSTIEQTSGIFSIPAGETKMMSFSEEGIGVTSVYVTAANALNDIKLKITSLTSLPSTITEASNEVYKYLQFTPTGIPEEDLESAKIRFKVEKSWLTENNIDSETVVLSKWTTQWEKLPTTKADEDSTYIYYDATTGGFSYFTITAEKIVTAAETEAAVEKETVQPISSSAIYWIIAIFIVVLMGAWMMYRKREFKYSYKHRQ